MSIDGSGRIVAVGRKAFSPGSIAVFRFNLDGTLDQSFGGTGIIYTSISGSNDNALSVAIQPDGKIVAAGHTSVTGGLRIALVRYLP